MSHPKSFARRLAVQAMYQWSLNQTEWQDLVAQFEEYDTWQKADSKWFTELIKEALKCIPDIDERLSAVSKRKLSELNPIELSILRLGAFELMHQPSVPFRVVLNEYINLAKLFGSSDKSGTYINASLDKIAKDVRSAEVSQP